MDQSKVSFFIWRLFDLLIKLCNRLSISRNSNLKSVFRSEVSLVRKWTNQKLAFFPRLKGRWHKINKAWQTHSERRKYLIGWTACLKKLPIHLILCCRLKGESYELKCVGLFAWLIARSQKNILLRNNVQIYWISDFRSITYFQLRNLANQGFLISSFRPIRFF